MSTRMRGGGMRRAFAGALTLLFVLTSSMEYTYL